MDKNYKRDFTKITRDYNFSGKEGDTEFFPFLPELPSESEALGDIEFAVSVLEIYLNTRKTAIEKSHLLPSHMEEAKGHVEKLESSIRKIKKHFLNETQQAKTM